MPEGVDEPEVRRRMRNKHRIEIGGGLGSLAGAVWRVGLMGEGARPEVVQRLLEALGECLATQGRDADVAGAVAAAADA